MVWELWIGNFCFARSAGLVTCHPERSEGSLFASEAAAWCDPQTSGLLSAVLLRVALGFSPASAAFFPGAVGPPGLFPVSTPS